MTHVANGTRSLDSTDDAAMGGRYTDPIPFNEKYMGDIPTEHGVYEIGTYRDGDFHERYDGKAEGKGGIRSRVRSHLRGDGNKDIADCMNDHERNNLYVRWQETEDAARKEARAIKKKNPSYNHRNEKVKPYSRSKHKAKK